MPARPASKPRRQKAMTPLPPMQRPRLIPSPIEPPAGLVLSGQARQVPLSHGGDPGPVRVLLLSRPARRAAV